MKHQDKITQMTLTEKCALLTGKDVWHTREIERLGLRSITLADGPSGLRKQAAAGDHLGLNESVPSTCMPSPSTMANSWDEAVVQSVGAGIGTEAKAEDVQVLLGPGLNVKRNPLCGRNFEYYSEDPYLSGKLAAAFIRGVQENPVSACAKHFAVNSQETLRMHSDSVLDERTLREIYLTGFEIVVKEGKPGAVMTSYNKVNGTYANENTHLLDDILRGEWEFDGAVVTDWGGSNDVVEGARAGMSLEMPAAGDDSACRLIEAVQSGELAESIVDERVDELLSLIVETETQAQAKEPKDNHKIAQAAAEASIVLLKNMDHILPLSRDSHVAVIGDFALKPRYQGAGSSLVNPKKIENIADIVKHYLPNAMDCAAGYLRSGEDSEKLTAQAEEMAKSAQQVILCLGLPESYEAEGMERKHMRLPENQVKLLKQLAQINDNIIVVLSAGCSVEMPWLPSCKALVYAGLGGQAGASAVLRTICGDSCPSGKLAETFPQKWSDVPSSAYYPAQEATAEYREGIYVGYRAFETADTPVLFPFGFGLSYTQFAYSNLEIEAECVSFDIKNTGDCDGAEIAQLYVSLPQAEVFRPKMELKGFAKVQLAAGESKRVSIPFDDKTFRYFNVKTNRFEIEKGIYSIQIGASIRDIRLTGDIAIDGTNAVNPYEGVDVDCYQKCSVANVSDASFRMLLGHDIPRQHWDRSLPLTSNDTVSQMFYAKNPLARGLCKMLKRMVDKSLAKGKPDLNILFIYSMPFRGMGKMMNGMVSMKMVDDILLMVNGHGFRGLGRLVRDFFRRPKLAQQTAKNAAK